jgi:hypothetical protein
VVEKPTRKVKTNCWYIFYKRFGRLKKFTYLCKTKEIDNDSDTNLKKVEKRFGRLKYSSYLCETKNKWSVRLVF